MSKEDQLKRILGEHRYSQIRKSTVLLVGAGGIGCELLKDLVLTGFGEIHVVDLDTVTLSNLNRQFLFQQKDIGKSKSLTVVKAVEQFNYFDAKLVPHHGNIMDTATFPISWFDKFNYIYNALDNLEARRYVNRMALFLNKPLMESGTTGYQGQVQPIYPHHSECFDCQAKATPTTFPVCTIRSTPSKPVHSITWAKEFLFQQLFDDSQTLTPQELEQQRQKLQAETDDLQEVESMLSETNELNDLKQSLRQGQFVETMIRKLFVKDIERLLLIETLWKNRTPPTPLDYDSYKQELENLLALVPDVSHDETRVWSVAENLYVLWKSSEALVQRLGLELVISFDKDDEETLDFVVASANLRSYVFGIPVQSKFDTKQIAGNIIPAIATTNALISGLSALESLEYFRASDSAAAANNSSTVFVSIQPNKYITAAGLVESSSKCVCTRVARAVLTLTQDLYDKFKLGDLISMIKGNLSWAEDIVLLGSNSNLLYDPDFQDLTEKKISELSIKPGLVLLVQDELDEIQDLELYMDIGEENDLPQWQLKEKVMDQELQEEKEEAGDMIMVGDDEVQEVEGPPVKKQRVVS